MTTPLDELSYKIIAEMRGMRQTGNMNWIE
jgi:hypothetical protein